MNYADSREIVRLCEQAGITLAVNQNMRYDHSMRALKTLLKRGYLGEPVLASIEMRAIPHWKPWQLAYTHLTLLNMSIHHLDSFRYLFGEPDSVYVSARKDPRTPSEHVDGVVLYILEYPGGFRATAWDDVWGWPGAGRYAAGPVHQMEGGGYGRDGAGNHRLACLSEPHPQHDRFHHQARARMLVFAALERSVVS